MDQTLFVSATAGGIALVLMVSCVAIVFCVCRRRSRSRRTLAKVPDDERRTCFPQVHHEQEVDDGSSASQRMRRGTPRSERDASIEGMVPLRPRQGEHHEGWDARSEGGEPSARAQSSVDAGHGNLSSRFSPRFSPRFPPRISPTGSDASRSISQDNDKSEEGESVDDAGLPLAAMSIRDTESGPPAWPSIGSDSVPSIGSESPRSVPGSGRPLARARESSSRRQEKRRLSVDEVKGRHESALVRAGPPVAPPVASLLPAPAGPGTSFPSARRQGQSTHRSATPTVVEEEEHDDSSSNSGSVRQGLGTPLSSDRRARTVVDC